MKKILCILLTVVLIAAAIPAFTVSSSAAGGTLTITSNGKVLGKVAVGNEFIYNVALDSAGYSPFMCEGSLICGSACAKVVEYGTVRSDGSVSMDSYSFPVRIRNSSLVTNYHAENDDIRYNFSKGNGGIGVFTTDDHFFKVRFKAVKAGTAEIHHVFTLLYTLPSYPSFDALELISDNVPNPELSPTPYVVETIDPAKAYIGDANGDYTLNVMDATFIQKKSAGVDVTCVQENADINKDGDVTLKDALLIVRYQAGMDTGTQVGEWIFESEQPA